MALPLDETISAGQSGHIADSQTIATVINGLARDVRAYGALGDGTTNDRAAIQSAIDAVSAAGGGVVFFPESTYRVDSTLDLASNVWLRGAGASSIIQRPASTGAGLPLIKANIKSNCGVADLKVDSGNTNLSGNGTIHFIDCTNSAVERCVIRNTHATTPAVVMQGAQRCWATHNEIDGSGYGIVFGSLSTNGSTETNDNVIAFNTVRNTPLDAIFVTASLGSSSTTNVGRRNRIIGNIVTGSADAAIESGIGMTGNIIQGNTCHGSAGPNILVRDNDGTQIIGNLCTGNTAEAAGDYGGGIAVLDQTSVSRRVSIIGNTCRDNTGAGIIVAPDSTLVGRDFIIANNHCRDNGGEGIYAWRCPGSVISGNLCAQNGGHGIHVKPVSATGEGNMAVTGNTCDGNTGHGIRVEAGYVTVTGNRCFDSSGGSQTHGVGLAGTQANYVTVMGNILQGNATAAISDDAAGTGHTIFNNKGWDNNRVYEASAFNLAIASNLDVGGKLAIAGNVGFYGTFPQARPAAYTQTYATADRTHAARTAAALTDNSGGTSGGTTIGAVTDIATAANAIATLAAMLNKVRDDSVDSAQLINSILDDAQTLGLLQ